MKYLASLLLLLLCSCSSAKNEPHLQHVRINLFSEPPTLDLRRAVDITSVNILLALFEGLTRVGSDNKIHPALAERIDISEDQLTYTFHLRKSVWSNGDPVTSHDFLNSWQEILEPLFPSPLAYKFFLIKNAALIKQGKLPMSDLGAFAPDGETLIVTLEHPAPYFLDLLSFAVFYPVHPTCQKNEMCFAEYGPQFITNGPFQLQSWEHDTKITLIKNLSYWDQKHVRLSQIEMMMVDDTTTEYHMFEMNELDWAGSPLSNLPSEVIPSLIQTKELITTPLLASYLYIMNTEVEVLRNKNIRKALSYAIDRKAIVDHILQAGEKPALSLVPLSPTAYFQDDATVLAQNCFAEGLKELNLTKETFPKLTLSFNTNCDHKKIASAIQQKWHETFGITIELEHCDWKVYLSKINSGNFQIARMGWVEEFPDPLSFLDPFKYKNDGILGSNNHTGWFNQEFTHLLDEAEQSTDPKKRSTQLKKAETLLLEEMPVIPIYFLTSKYIKKPYVKNLFVSEGGTIDFKEAYIDQKTLRKTAESLILRKTLYKN